MVGIRTRAAQKKPRSYGGRRLTNNVTSISLHFLSPVLKRQKYHINWLITTVKWPIFVFFSLGGNMDFQDYLQETF